jgi:hypothetical protein
MSPAVTFLCPALWKILHKFCDSVKNCRLAISGKVLENE